MHMARLARANGSWLSLAREGIHRRELQKPKQTQRDGTDLVRSRTFRTPCYVKTSSANAVAEMGQFKMEAATGWQLHMMQQGSINHRASSPGHMQMRHPN